MTSKEEMRQARLRAFDAKPLSSDSAVSTNASPRITPAACSVSPMAPEVFRDLQRLIYKGGAASEEDIYRWQQEGIQLYGPPHSWGLRQVGGGPCGLLAVVQSELLRELLFAANPLSPRPAVLPVPSASEASAALVNALLTILQRAAANGPMVVAQFAADGEHSWTAEHVVTSSHRTPEEVRRVLSAQLEHLARGPGCLLFLTSLVLTKGVGAIRSEMDDYGGRLVGQFGHCNQELLNLLLTGTASSNVFDGEMALGGADMLMDAEGQGLMVRGIRARSSIGYLSHLEALRYCQVGSYLKIPRFPIWVLGSSSHFSVLFSLSLSHGPNEEALSQQLLSALQRAFKAVDAQECGFVPADQLPSLLRHIQHAAPSPLLARLLSHSDELSRLRGLLAEGGDLILWSSFWVHLSQLISGSASLDDLVSVQVHGVVQASGGRPRSDSEVARELQAQWDSPSAAFPAAPSIQRSDSDIAREMQAQWDAEDDPLMMIAVDNDDAPPPLVPVSAPASLPGSSAAAPAPVAEVPYTLYHFNGLQTGDQRGTLTALTLYKRSSADIIGKAVALESGGDGTGSFIRPIEEVLRTRWPGCRVTWEGPAPSID